MADILIKGVCLSKDWEMLSINVGRDGKVSRSFDLNGEQIAEAIIIPTHGRLIDGEELKELFRETITGIATRTDMKGEYEHMIRASAMVIEMIDDAPTVIEAKEEKEDV